MANRKRVLRIMRQNGMLSRGTPVGEGTAPRRQGRGDALEPALVLRRLEFTCWNGDVVRMAFIIDAFDREIIAWHAVAGAGISGSMVRDMMLEAVERRFAAIQAPHALE